MPMMMGCKLYVDERLTKAGYSLLDARHLAVPYIDNRQTIRIEVHVTSCPHLQISRVASSARRHPRLFIEEALALVSLAHERQISSSRASRQSGLRPPFVRSAS